jgi:hypothetical protein
VCSDKLDKTPRRGMVCLGKLTLEEVRDLLLEGFRLMREREERTGRPWWEE